MTCLDVAKFIGAPPREPTVSLARLILEHASGCEACGRQLSEAKDHAALLLQVLEDAERREAARNANPVVEEQEDFAIRAAQMEYVMFGRAAMRYLDRDLVRSLAKPLPEEQVDEAFSHLKGSDLSDPVATKLAIAQLDGGLEMSALMGPRKGLLRRTGSLTIADEVVEAAHFTNVVHESIGVSDAGIWKALVQCSLNGDVGVPDFYWRKISPDVLELTVPPIEEPDLVIRPARPM